MKRVPLNALLFALSVPLLSACNLGFDDDDSETVKTLQLDISNTYYFAEKKDGQWQQQQAEKVTIKLDKSFETVTVCEEDDTFIVRHQIYDAIPDTEENVTNAKTCSSDDYIEDRYNVSSEQSNIFLVDYGIVKNKDTEALELYVLGYDKVNNLGYFKKKEVAKVSPDDSPININIEFNDDEKLNIIDITDLDDRYSYRLSFQFDNSSELLRLSPEPRKAIVPSANLLQDGVFMESFYDETVNASYTKTVNQPTYTIEQDLSEKGIVKQDLTFDINSESIYFNRSDLISSNSDYNFVNLDYSQEILSSGLSYEVFINKISDGQTVHLPIINFSDLPGFPVDKINQLAHYDNDFSNKPFEFSFFKTNFQFGKKSLQQAQYNYEQ